MKARADEPFATVAMVSPADVPESRNKALNVLFTLHYAALVRLAHLLVDDPESAEDVVMDAFVGLSRRWSTLRDVDRAEHYLRRAVVNGSRSRLRHLIVVRRRDPAARTPVDASVEDQIVSADERDTVVAWLRQLPPRQRQVLVLRYYLGLSEAEIATELGISRGSVKTHASRGLAALAGALEAPR